jgi:deazaflavin-dependent oxidoreductase (nitroreductase family)
MKTCPKMDDSTLSLLGRLADGVLGETPRCRIEKNNMTTMVRVPAFVRVGNMMTTALLRAGVRLNGYGRPMYLLTVRGRKSGQPRTTPVVVIEQDGERYLVSPYGITDWVRNLRAAGQAMLTRGRRAEEVRALELPAREAALMLMRILSGSLPAFLTNPLGVTSESPLEEIERAALSHPVFALQSAA